MAKDKFICNLKAYMHALGFEHPFTKLTGWGVPKSAAARLLKGNVKNISTDQLASICVHLQCTPNDILLFKPGTPLQVGHPLSKLTQNLFKDMRMVRAGLSPADVKVLEEMALELLKRKTETETTPSAT